MLLHAITVTASRADLLRARYLALHNQSASPYNRTPLTISFPRRPSLPSHVKLTRQNCCPPRSTTSRAIPTRKYSDPVQEMMSKIRLRLAAVVEACSHIRTSRS